MVKQNILIKRDSPMEIAKAYYSVLLGANGIHITKGQLALLAFSAIYGTLSSPPIRERYIKEIGRASTIGNILSYLREKEIMVKIEGKIRVNPKIHHDFKEEPLLLTIGLKLNKNESEGK